MKILNIGSMNLDYVYQMDHIVMPGETEESSGMDMFLGGKGFNQTVALAKAGAEVYHAGLIGEDGKVFLGACKQYGIQTKYIKMVAESTGHAIIQIDKQAENCILLYGGANQQFTKEYIDYVLADFAAGDLLLIQNEINLLPYIVEVASEKGMTIALNPSPFNDKLKSVDLTKINIFILNEVEGYQITGETKAKDILNAMHQQFPTAKMMLTLGKKGAIYSDQEQTLEQASFTVKAVDTTAAGDTFTGYFLAGLLEQLPIEEILKRSAKASSIAVTRHGAIPSIPEKNEVIENLPK
ncbi:ribokinase [Granulicatella balaenopterae]|uniref:Ribokinase n=1 Tax=Granulicatella balaenopterae TaxID=137733 RepID=A0A1H9LH64_9LACT|nr:ribokinase [Granulicatella balaenopterae]SER10720.1 ribokinase [Granulicatella balaenopterae]